MMARTSLLGALATGLLLALLIIAPTQAHGIGKTLVLNEAAGPYLLSVWTDPDPLRADETHVVVGVTDPATRQPIVSGVEVTITLSAVDDPTLVFSETAGTDNVNRFFYAAEFNDQVTEGRWQVGVRVTGESGTGELAGHEIDVVPPRRINWMWLGVGGVVVAVVVWFAGSMRTAGPPSPTARRERPKTVRP